MTRETLRRTVLLLGLLALAALPACGGGGGGGGGGYTNYALWFDGGFDFVQIPDQGDFDFTFSFTLEAWVRPDSLIASPFYAGIVGSPSDFVMSLDDTIGGSDQTAWFCTVCTPGCNAAQSPVLNLTVGTWQHLAAVYNGFDITLYRNGQFVASIGHTGDVQNVATLWIGLWEIAFHGAIDEVRVWNVARSQGSIQATMNALLAGSEPGLVGYWRFDEGSGQQVFDMTAGLNDGQLGSTLGVDGDDPTWVLSAAPVS